MDRYTAHVHEWSLLVLVLCCTLLVVGLLSACSNESQHVVGLTSPATSTLRGSTRTVGMGATFTPNEKQTSDTRVAQFDATIAAQVTLSPRPTAHHGPIYSESPIPTPTWAVGYFPGPRPENTFNPEYFTCWYGALNDKLLSICAGHEQFGGDLEQGVIRIRVLEQDQVTVVSHDIYRTPEKVGVVHIVTADNNLVTVASEDGQHIFTFDIATRQWVTP